MASAEALWRWLRQWRREHLQVDRVAVLRNVDENGQLGPRYAFMTVMACGIATLGLLQNSVAVIIGAMLISPLMGPIVELGMSLATFDFRSLRESLKTLAVGTAVALVTATAIVLVSPLQEATPEILARTEPTLFDLLVAVFSGLAGAYATITRKGETIVGVAIATALMPPLAVVGFGIATLNASIAGGALFLFMTNLLAIALSVTIMARWYQFGGDDSPKQTAWQASMIVGTFVLLSIPLGLALRDIAARGFADRTIRNVMDEAARSQGGQLTTLRVERNDDVLRVDAVMLLPRHRPQLDRELERKLEPLLAKPVEVSLRELLTADEKALASEQASLAQLRESVVRLQGVAERDAAQRSAGTRATEAMHQQAIAHFGKLDVLEGGQQARWQLNAAGGLDIVQARRLEQALAGNEAGALQVEVVPALQALPPITFGDERSELDAEAATRVEAIAWALQRWGVDRIRVDGFAGNDAALALARAESVAAALEKLGIRGATARAVPGADARSAAASEGATVLREVRVRPATL
ncbi:TIGR00341 family protein [Pseudoxanthomonas sp. LjRoot168]|uniref:TIGR00341 family protein n=1 Tax=unclassified Pseudoxanthomonas TaxID=2645906 RepID=UPI003ED12B33